MFNVVKFPCCDVRYEFRVKRCSFRLYYYLLCRRFTFYYLFWCHLKVTRRVAIVEQELLTLPEHLRSPRLFCGVRVARSLVFCVVFCRSLIGIWFFLWPLYCLSVVELLLLITSYGILTSFLYIYISLISKIKHTHIYISNLVRMTRFWNTCNLQYTSDV